MAWARMDDQFYDHPKVLALLDHDEGLAAIGLWSLALGWAKRHADPHCPEEAGAIPASLPRRLGGSSELAKLLVRVGLWAATGNGWVIHDFAHWQDLDGWADRSAKAARSARARWDKVAAARDGKVQWRSTVYYMAWPGSEPGLVKIGCAQDVEARRRSLAWNGRLPELLAAEPATGSHYELESTRQEQFAHLSTIPSDGPAEGRREVFRLAPELEEFMDLLRRTHLGWESQTTREVPESSTKSSASSQETDAFRIANASASASANASANAMLTTPHHTEPKEPLDEVLRTSSSSDVASRRSDVASDAGRADVEGVCLHLADRIEQNGSARPVIGRSWRDAARRMLDRDGRTEDQVHKAIDWCQDDEFWRGNIMSMAKLRQQYDRLRLSAARRNNRGVPGAPSTGDQRVAQAQALKAKLSSRSHEEEP